MREQKRGHHTDQKHSVSELDDDLLLGRCVETIEKGRNEIQLYNYARYDGTWFERGQTVEAVPTRNALSTISREEFTVRYIHNLNGGVSLQPVAGSFYRIDTAEVLEQPEEHYTLTEIPEKDNE